MDGDAAKAKRYRVRAGELRKIADGLVTGNTQRMILGLALEYDRLAGLLDESDARVIVDPTSPLAALKKPDNSS
jgi:hypothetical protein